MNSCEESEQHLIWWPGYIHVKEGLLFTQRTGSISANSDRSATVGRKVTLDYSVENNQVATIQWNRYCLDSVPQHANIFFFSVFD